MAWWKSINTNLKIGGCVQSSTPTYLHPEPFRRDELIKHRNKANQHLLASVDWNTASYEEHRPMAKRWARTLGLTRSPDTTYGRQFIKQ